MKLLQLILLFLAFTVTVENVYAQISPQAQLLEDAYQTKSIPKLKSFFENWQKEIPAISDSELNTLNKYDREAYAVFKAFYHPENMPRQTDSLGENINYSYSDYLVVQNDVAVNLNQDLNIVFCQNYSEAQRIMKKMRFSRKKNQYSYIKTEDTSAGFALITFGRNLYDEGFLKDSIKNFRPQIDCGKKIPVYLTQSREQVLKEFLNNDSNKYEFMGSCIKTVPITGISSRQVGSFPILYTISFNKEMTVASVIFRKNNKRLCISLVEKKDGHWQEIWVLC